MLFSSIIARNVQDAYLQGIDLVEREGIEEETRNGPALVVPWPVVTVYQNPVERVLIDPGRDANPFFHLMESIWMLAGRDDVASIVPFLGNLRKFSDDGSRFHGAYGDRWRHAGRIGQRDQLAEIVRLLRRNPFDRRVVLQMWDCDLDLAQEGVDFPCNTHVYFRAVDTGEVGHPPALDMTVMCRSNDAIWGAYGANAVHFSVLQEFVASACGMQIGTMYQLSNNLHAYLDVISAKPAPDEAFAHLYDGHLVPTRLFAMTPETPVGELLDGLEAFWDRSGRVGGTFTQGGLQTLSRARDAHAAFKMGDYELARQHALDIPGRDWSRACREWIDRHAHAPDGPGGSPMEWRGEALQHVAGAPAADERGAHLAGDEDHLDAVA